MKFTVTDFIHGCHSALQKHGNFNTISHVLVGYCGKSEVSERKINVTSDIFYIWYSYAHFYMNLVFATKEAGTFLPNLCRIRKSSFHVWHKALTIFMAWRPQIFRMKINKQKWFQDPTEHPVHSTRSHHILLRPDLDRSLEEKVLKD